MENGVYILNKDNDLVLPDNWNTEDNDKAVGVALITDDCKISIDLQDFGSYYVKDYNYYNVYEYELLQSSSSKEANYFIHIIPNYPIDWNFVNERKSDIYYYTYDKRDIVYINYEPSCIFTKLAKQQRKYIPALGDIITMYSYEDTINSALTLVGGQTMSDTYYAATSLYTYHCTRLVQYDWSTGNYDIKQGYNASSQVRLITPIEEKITEETNLDNHLYKFTTSGYTEVQAPATIITDLDNITYIPDYNQIANPVKIHIDDDLNVSYNDIMNQINDTDEGSEKGILVDRYSVECDNMDLPITKQGELVLIDSNKISVEKLLDCILECKLYVYIGIA